MANNWNRGAIEYSGWDRYLLGWLGEAAIGYSPTSVADSFVAWAEFRALYAGATSNREIVARFRRNVLGREGDAGGMDFWTSILDRKAASVGGVLADQGKIILLKPNSLLRMKTLGAT